MLKLDTSTPEWEVTGREWNLENILPSSTLIAAFMAIATMGALKQLFDEGKAGAIERMLLAEFRTLEEHVIDPGFQCEHCFAKVEAMKKVHALSASVILNNYFADRGDFRKMFNEAHQKMKETTGVDVEKYEIALKETIDVLIKGVLLIHEAAAQRGK